MTIIQLKKRFRGVQDCNKCKDNRMNTELVIPYYTILEEKPITCSSICNEISFL